MNNIIECKLESTYKEIFTGLWQYDYGQKLRITGGDFPEAVEIQFSLNKKSGSVITRIGTTTDGVTEVKIPDELLKNEGQSQNYSIYAYIYLTDESSGNTEYQIILHVKSRTKPENPSEEPLPEPNIFHETVVAVNASADRAETAEKNAKESAEKAETTLVDMKETVGNLTETVEQAEKLDGNLDKKLEQGENIVANIKDKLDAPENPMVGKYLRVKAVNEDGVPELECVYEPSGGSSLDIQINGQSIVKDGIAEIPIAKNQILGLAQPTSRYRISQRTPDNVNGIYANQYISNSSLDAAVVAAMCDGKGAAWTEEEQASARERIGIPTDWQLVDDITIEKAVVKIAIDTDYSQYNEIMIQTMLQPTENNVLVKVISSNNPNTVDPWRSNIALLEAPKTTDKTVYSITILERNNLGIFVKKQLASANNHSVSANLIPTVAYCYAQAVPRDINGNKISANVITDDFEIICSQPQTSFKYLTIGSYKEAIAPGSKFKIYAR